TGHGPDETTGNCDCTAERESAAAGTAPAAAVDAAAAAAAVGITSRWRSYERATRICFGPRCSCCASEAVAAVDVRVLQTPRRAGPEDQRRFRRGCLSRGRATRGDRRSASRARHPDAAASRRQRYIRATAAAAVRGRYKRSPAAGQWHG